jgi:hypothetical protein
MERRPNQEMKGQTEGLVRLVRIEYVFEFKENQMERFRLES